MPQTTLGQRRLLLFCLLLCLCFSIAAIRESEIARKPPAHSGPIARISGKNWGYDLTFPVYNAATIGKLIDCESQGLNVVRTDSNGQMSLGVLQFNGTSTWQEMERRFHFYGDPRNPPQAIHMADLMISNGLVSRWTCARRLGLVK